VSFPRNAAEQLARAQGIDPSAACPREVVTAAVESKRDEYWSRFRRDLDPGEVSAVERGVELRWRPEAARVLPADAADLVEAVKRADPTGPRWGYESRREPIREARAPWEPPPAHERQEGPHSSWSMTLNGELHPGSDPSITAAVAAAEVERAAIRQAQHERIKNLGPVMNTIAPPT
jgi:hypothetical protein